MENDDLFEPSNMVMMCNIDSSLNLSMISELITLVPVNFTLNSRQNNRVKIPFFGIEKAVISVSYDLKRRGIRKGGGQLRNIVAIDLQYHEKNIHVKISEKNLLLMGILNFEMGKEASIVCLKHIKMINKLWINLKELSPEILKNTYEWLMETLIEEDTLLMFDDDKVKESFANLRDENVNYKAARYLSMFTYDYDTVESFKEKIEKIFKLIDGENYCYSKELKIINFEIANSVYNYKLDTELPMIKLCTELLKRGCGVLYDNWNEPKTLYVMLALSMLVNKDVNKDENEDDEVKKLIEEGDTVKNTLKKIKKSKIKAHRFQVNKCGSIRQTSPTSVEDALQVRNFVVSNIYDILEN